MIRIFRDDGKLGAGGWRAVAELGGSSGAVVRSYLWGKGLSGELEGAGGIGGLLMVREGGATYAARYDANGNLGSYNLTDDNIALWVQHGPTAMWRRCREGDHSLRPRFRPGFGEMKAGAPMLLVSHRRWLTLLLFLNLAAIPLLYFVARLEASMATQVTLSTYREMQHAGVIVINREAAERYRDGGVLSSEDNEWTDIPVYLTQAYGGPWEITGIFIIVCVMNCVILGILLQSTSFAQRAIRVVEGFAVVDAAKGPGVAAVPANDDADPRD